MLAPVWFGDKQCIDPVAFRKSCLEAHPPVPVDSWWGKVNRFDNKSGHLSGTGGVLMLRRDLLDLDLNVTHELRMRDHFGEEVKLKKIHVAGPTVCLNSSSPDNNLTVHFVPLADNRRRWQLTAINLGYNLRITPNGNYDTDTATDADTAYTATEIITDLWDELPATAGDVPTLPGTPRSPVDNLAYWGWKAPDAIGHFLHRCQYEWCYDPLKDEHEFVEIGAEQVGLKAEFDKLQRLGLRIWDLEPLVPLLGTVPSQVRVYFRKSPGPRAYAQTPYFSVTVSAPARDDGKPTDGEEGTLSIYDDLLAKYQGRELQNESDLNSRAKARADAIWQSRRDYVNAPMRRVYSGYLDDIKCGSQVAAISWLDTGYGPQTAIELRPTVDPIASWRDTDHQPWRDIEWVEIDTPDSGAGDGIAPSGYYSGRVFQWNSSDNSKEYLFNCWWRGANSENPFAGWAYKSTFEGYKTNSSNQLRPVYMGGCCEGTESGSGAGSGGGGVNDHDDRPPSNPEPEDDITSACCPGVTIGSRLYATIATTPSTGLDGLIVTLDSDSAITCDSTGVFSLEHTDATACVAPTWSGSAVVPECEVSPGIDPITELRVCVCCKESGSFAVAFWPRDANGNDPLWNPVTDPSQTVACSPFSATWSRTFTANEPQCTLATAEITITITITD